MEILILSGSAFPNSHTKCMAHKIADLIEQPEHTVNIVDLIDLNIPLLGQGKTDDVEKLKRMAENADAIIIGTPNYHSSFSGVLKNALDHLSSDEFKYKPVGLFSNSGGIHSSDPLTQLRIVLRSLHAIVVPNQLLTNDKDFELVDGQYVMKKVDFDQRISVMVDAVLLHAEIYNKGTSEMSI